MLNLFELKKQQSAALIKAEALLGSDDHKMTTAENESYQAAMTEYEECAVNIKERERVNSIRTNFADGRPIVEQPREGAESARPAWLTAKYRAAVSNFLKSRGTQISADLQVGMDGLGGFHFPGLRMETASYEGGSTSGAPLYQIAPVDTNIIPLAPPEMGIQKLALVIPTSMDLPMAQKTGFGTASPKAEGTGNGSNLFAYVQSPTTAKFTLSAHMVGHPEDASWELLQDVNTFQQFLVDDILLSIAELKEGYWWGGNSDGIQGLKGNIGAGSGTAVAPTSNSYFSALLDATFDVLGTLNVYYYPNAAFLMQRAASVGIRKAQKQANLFEPVFTRVNGQDFLHGFPVEYSAAVDTAIEATPGTAITGNVPIVFGDFKRGYVIGERGGSGVNIKILDQPKALEGLLTILGYQRVDGHVRRSEALQPIILA